MNFLGAEVLGLVEGVADAFSQHVIVCREAEDVQLPRWELNMSRTYPFVSNGQISGMAESAVDRCFEEE